MSTIKRTPIGFRLPRPGPFVATITSHLDPTLLGGVEAVLAKGTFDDARLQNQTYPLGYLSPFAGNTDQRFQGTDKTSYHSVQKSYGFWGVPPDVGAKVLCIFVDGDPNQGYWLGCIPDTFQNYMTPGIAASPDVAWGPGEKDKYDVTFVPVAEMHSSIRTSDAVNVEKKPVHPFADRLLAQGLLADRVRGITSSSARREFPTQVFGISTPGRPDPTGPKGTIGYQDEDQKNQGSYNIPISRTSGHTFVMDDGDVNGQNQLVRLRSSSGHQILLNDSAQVLYIANAAGTAWLEFTKDGKIDIFATDSVSIHSENDFNLRAGRDFNIEAARDVNIRSGNNTVINAEKEYNLRAIDSAKVFIGGQFDQFVKADYNLSIQGNANIFGQTKLNITASGEISLSTQGAYKVYAASKSQFGKPGTIAGVATDAIRETIELKKWSVPRTSPGAGWKTQRYQLGDISSILQRVPMHEPWPHHESYDPGQFTSDRTDVGNNPSLGTGNSGGNAAGPATPANINEPAAWVDDDEFIKKVKAVAKKYNADYIDLLAVMYFETGGKMSASTPNSAGSGAVGLIQFMPSTATKTLSTTSSALAKMTRVQQMDYVDMYFSKLGLSRVAAPNVADLYMVVLCPRALGKPDSATAYSDLDDEIEKFGKATEGVSKEKQNYRANSGLDKNKDRIITKGEATAPIIAKRPQIIAQLKKAGYIK
jgi:hypothetical protein